MPDLRFPVGEFVARPSITQIERQELIASLEAVPARLRDAITGLSEHQLETPYRPEGWTVRQTVHHVADSHINAYVRFKLGLTEDMPTVKPYAEERWALLEDGRSADPEISLRLLDAVHERWTILLRSLPPDAFAHTLRHPVDGVMSLDVVLQSYEWHGRHHIAHITSLRQRMRW
ncbi:MAG TPA: putative metal-dependent hydrolase [Blastocatellia bacterium]|nr:putative metal-dependent hydrolase [Blastocatellia bacterium]